jgi:hypothetical protein
MKKRSMIFVALLVLSVMVISVVPVLAARQPKSNQVLIKVLDASGKGYAKAGVYLEQPATGARSDVLTTKGNGVVAISLSKNTYISGWTATPPLTVWVYNNELTTYFTFSPFYFDSSLSASITIETGW